MELIHRFEWIFYILLILLALMMILCLIRAVMGPRLTDRLISVNMIAYRSQYGSADPAAIIAPSIVATLCSTVVGMVYCKIKDRSDNAK